MKILIAEDDFVSRKFLAKIFSQYGEVDTVFDGLEAVDAYMMAMREKEPYDLICLDIMMPKADGLKVLKAIRDLETQHKVATEDRAKIIMTTALSDESYVQKAFADGCQAYAAKPIDVAKLVEVMSKLGFSLNS
ncbi:response regulator [Heliophilum fasciatum]|uniref:response regulator n=1 Tax=Heliophilum fasciatum TaxID=35700 RepID=UPI001A9ACC28|nr:response regulator [Heliophilum fasciatum]